MPKKTAKADQSKLFIEKAREIACDENIDEDEIMRRLAAQGRPPERKPKSKAKKPAK